MVYVRLRSRRWLDSSRGDLRAATHSCLLQNESRFQLRSFGASLKRRRTIFPSAVCSNNASSKRTLCSSSSSNSSITMRARAPPPSAWRLWHPRNGLSFAPSHTPEATTQNRPQPLYPDLSGYHSIHSTSASCSTEPLTTLKTLQCEGEGTKQESGCLVAGPPVAQAAVQPSPENAAPSVLRQDVEAEHQETEAIEGAEPEVDLPPSTTLDFKMDVELFRAAKQARQGSMNSYWTYTLYRGPQGEKVRVHYCKSEHTTERVCQYFLDEKVIGLDLEWVPDARKSFGARRNVCLVQLASPSRIALFHLALYPKDDSLVAPSLKLLLEDSGISKVGVNIKADCTRLRTWLGIDPKGVFELSHLYKLVKYTASGETHLINRRAVSLAEQVKAVLGLPMFKGQNVRSSDWSKPLKMEQIIYSSSDAYAGPQIYNILEQQREALDPTPPRPYHVELGLPIRLANGQATAAVEEGTEDVEVEDNEEASYVPPEEELIKSASDTLTLEPDLDEAAPKVSLVARSASRPKADVAKPAKDDRVVAAEDWLTEYRASCKSPPRATAAALRAYRIWSQNNDLSPSAVASLLRNPPLQTNTVHTYILDAIKKEKLPYEHARLRDEVLAEVPLRTLLSRYAALEQQTRNTDTSSTD
ncbi:hypothetical protein PpBr36_07049 [Pyricularia pennisetigena]|uniref:hypothetical protein n=1 Tax=Pyricularia pennisetigena TaxID=1578925 RepID=UPI001153169F|nr:hypothetical protein PpBr36_07049 [Pyricularia pennisetigena]TLS25812.1 hypothetical protein PpBr36_07049 [Pyricularia pennisetigena]